MSEPLTKDKISKECDETCTEDTEIVHLNDLKSALEEFERLCDEEFLLTYHHNAETIIKERVFQTTKLFLKKAFPAIYEQENGDE